MTGRHAFFDQISLMMLTLMFWFMEATDRLACTWKVDTMAVSTMPMAQPKRFCSAMGSTIPKILRIYAVLFSSVGMGLEELIHSF